MRPRAQEGNDDSLAWRQLFNAIHHNTLLPVLALIFCVMVVISVSVAMRQMPLSLILVALGSLLLVTGMRVFSALRIAWLTRDSPANAFVMHPQSRHFQSQQNLTRLLRMMSGQLGETDAARLRLLMTDRDFTPEDYEMLRVLDEENPTFYGATQAEIDRLPTRILTQTDLANLNKEHRTCAVCLGNYAVGDELRTLTCLHHFHKTCVDSWLHRNAICPVCKFPIFG